MENRHALPICYRIAAKAACMFNVGMTGNRQRIMRVRRLRLAVFGGKCKVNVHEIRVGLLRFLCIFMNSSTAFV